MKGVIFGCLKELVETEHGAETWGKVLDHAGLETDTTFLPINDIDDAVVMKTLQCTCEVLGVATQDLANSFGRYWACTYAPRMYGVYYGGVRSAKEFLVKLDDVHLATTRALRNARPPRFTCENVDKDTLIMEYHSSRQLTPFFHALIHGAAEHFGEVVHVTPEGPNRVRIRFASR